jgi:hypothetical protein
MYVLLYCGVCTGVRLLPPGENPIAVRNNNNKKTVPQAAMMAYRHSRCIPPLILNVK